MKNYPIVEINENKGRCVIATSDYSDGDIIMVNHVGLIGVDDLKQESLFDQYLVRWDELYNSIAFGYINLLNHSSAPNCELICNYDNLTITCKAIDKVISGDELTIKYACNLWFIPVLI